MSHSITIEKIERRRLKRDGAVVVVQTLDKSGPMMLASSFDLFSKTSNENKQYVCGECGARVMWKSAHLRSEKKVQVRGHFAHVASTDHCSGGEGLVHKLCKQWIADHAASLVLLRKCPDCGQDDEFHASTMGEVQAELEWKTDAYRVDVSFLFMSTQKRWAVEIMHTHAIGQSKRSALEQLSDQVFEIATADILTGKPLRDSVSQQCRDCASEIRYLQKHRDRLPWSASHLTKHDLQKAFDRDIFGDGNSLQTSLEEVRDNKLDESYLPALENVLVNKQVITIGSKEDWIVLKMLDGSHCDRTIDSLSVRRPTPISFYRIQQLRSLLAYYHMPRLVN